MNETDSAKRARQKRTITILATLLIVAGLIVLLLLQRMPLPMRILVGLTDVFGGLVLLVLVRQKF
jgi:fatty acid desaturase